MKTLQQKDWDCGRTRALFLADIDTNVNTDLKHFCIMHTVLKAFMQVCSLDRCGKYGGILVSNYHIKHRFE